MQDSEIHTAVEFLKNEILPLHRSNSRLLSSEEMPPFLSENELATWLDMSAGTLRNWRVKGKGPTHCKISGSTVRCPRQAVIDWLSERCFRNTSEAGQ